MKYTYNDGGRQVSGYKGGAGDCAVRAAAIVTGLPYQVVYDAINLLAEDERPRGKKRRSNSSAGVWPKTLGKFLEQNGFTWVATMGIGTGCQVHLNSSEIPNGRIVARVSKHYTAIIDGIIHDTHDPSRDGTRCVYGYWITQ
jgi:hypothetical protein